MTRPSASLNWYEPGPSGIVPAGGRETIGEKATPVRTGNVADNVEPILALVPRPTGQGRPLVPHWDRRRQQQSAPGDPVRPVDVRVGLEPVAARTAGAGPRQGARRADLAPRHVAAGERTPDLDGRQHRHAL